jgi:hypothetical protein
VTDRVVQAALKLVLEPVFEKARGRGHVGELYEGEDVGDRR